MRRSTTGMNFRSTTRAWKAKARLCKEAPWAKFSTSRLNGPVGDRNSTETRCSAATSESGTRS
eukprot:929186-Lingulodinium_polyedra.AAC.1